MRNTLCSSASVLSYFPTQFSSSTLGIILMLAASCVLPKRGICARRGYTDHDVYASTHARKGWLRWTLQQDGKQDSPLLLGNAKNIDRPGLMQRVFFPTTTLSLPLFHFRCEQSLKLFPVMLSLLLREATGELGSRTERGGQRKEK